MKLLILLLSVTSVLAQNAKIGIVDQDIKYEDGSEIENEYISVELRKPNEDIKFVAEVRFHLIKGQFHVNGHPLYHNDVHSVQMMVMITDIINGVEQTPQQKLVQMRVLVQEMTINGTKQLLVEEEFISIGSETVEQIDVQQGIFELNGKVSFIKIKLTESRIHKRSRENDHEVKFSSDETHLPDEHSQGDDYYRKHCHHHGHHHKRHHHHGHHHHNSTFNQRARCYYHRLGWKAKVSLFSLGFFGLLTAVICCGMCTRRRRRNREFAVRSPMDDTVTVDVDKLEAPKKVKDDGNFDFHFKMDDKTVVIDDKKALVEDA